MRALPLTFLCLIIVQLGWAQLTLHITVPQNTPLLDEIHVGGTFNSWNPSDGNYTLTANTDGSYQITFNPPVGNFEFKFTRGSWPTVEADANGVDIGDRTLYYGGGQQTENLTVESWLDLGPTSPTMGIGVYWLDDDMHIAQLNRNRRVWIYLPPNYYSSNEYYRVLYMHDAQNLFDVSTSFSGEWEIDETLNDLFANGDAGAIVVGIDNGEAFRIDEYSPWNNPNYGGGEGDLYIDFIVQTLKPLVDANFRTLSGREHTGIMGSSMGGLISMYGAIEHQAVFGKAGILSPSFWFSSEAYTHVTNTGMQENMRIVLMAGEQESSSMVTNLNTMYATLTDAGFLPNDINITTHWDGQHAEWYWRREFWWVYQWLFANTTVDIEDNERPKANVFPNPFSNETTIQVNTNLKQGDELVITDLLGRVIVSRPLKTASLRIQANETGKGVFYANILSTDGSRTQLGKLVVN